MAEVYDAHVSRETSVLGADPATRNVSWSGILAGLLAGLATYITLMVLGLAVGMVTIDSANPDAWRAFSIGTLTWCAVAAAIAAFVGGFTAARGAGFLTPAQGRFHGVLTGLLMVLIITVYSVNMLWRAASQAANAAGSALTTTAMIAGNAAANARQADISSLMNSVGLEDEYQALVSGFNPDELRETIAEASPQLTERQIAAASGVVRTVLMNARRDVAGNLNNLSNLNQIVTAQANYVQEQLTNPEFTNRLQARGLTPAQAQEVSAVINQRTEQLRTQARETTAAFQRQVDAFSERATRTIGQAAWFWLLSTGLIVGLALAGGHVGGNAWNRGQFVDSTDPDRMPTVAEPTPTERVS